MECPPPKNGHCREVAMAIVERFHMECPPPKNGHCREVAMAIVERFRMECPPQKNGHCREVPYGMSAPKKWLLWGGGHSEGLTVPSIIDKVIY